MTELFDRLMSGRVELCTSKEINSILTASGTIRITVRRKIMSKILDKANVKKFITTAAVLHTG